MSLPNENHFITILPKSSRSLKNSIVHFTVPQIHSLPHFRGLSWFRQGTKELHESILQFITPGQKGEKGGEDAEQSNARDFGPLSPVSLSSLAYWFVATLWSVARREERAKAT